MEWKIERMRDRCGACATPFTHEQRVVSVIAIDDATERATRRDLCEACARDGVRGLLWWTTHFEQQARKKKVDFDRLLRLFEHWQREPPAGQEALVYLIALLLVRKRFLRMADLVTVDGRECLRLKRPGPNEQWYVTPAPLLTAADLPQLRARLEDLIDGSFEEEEMPETADASRPPSSESASSTG